MTTTLTTEQAATIADVINDAADQLRDEVAAMRRDGYCDDDVQPAEARAAALGALGETLVPAPAPTEHYACDACGCAHTQITAWIDANTDRIHGVGGEGPSDQVWCPNCEDDQARIDFHPVGWTPDAINDDHPEACPLCPPTAN